MNSEKPQIPRFPIVVLISGRGSNLHALIEQQHAGKLNIDIKLVISNRANAAGLAMAESFGIPTRVIDHTQYCTRLDYDQQLIHVIDRCQPKLVVLAGFMRILTSEFVSHYNGKLINIHPSLLPKFKGINTHQRALEAGETEHGASVHFVTEELDSGAVLMQAKVPVLENDDAETLAARVLEQEHDLYPEAVWLIAENRVKLVDSQIEFDDKPLAKPLLLESAN